MFTVQKCSEDIYIAAPNIDAVPSLEFLCLSLCKLTCVYMILAHDSFKGKKHFMELLVFISQLC